MKILSIDTTSRRGSIALSEDGVLLAQEIQGQPGTHVDRLFISIDHLLQIAMWKRAEIEGVAVAIGPGSFTGLRVGLAAAKGIALALNIPIVGVSSLKSLALNCPIFDGTIVSIIDARRGEVYSSAHSMTNGKQLKTVMDEGVMPPQELIKVLKKIKGKLVLIGDGAIEYCALFKSKLGARAIIPDGASSFPQAINLAQLAMTKFKRGKGDELSSLAPNYIRRSDAEIGFLGKEKCSSKVKGKR